MSASKNSKLTVVSFRDSLLKALDEQRYDDLVLLLANRMRLSRETISPLARACLPVDASKASPIRNTPLTKDEIDMFDFKEIGWYLVAVKDHKIVGAERFAISGDIPDFKDKLIEYMESLLGYYGADAQIFAAYHSKGMLVEWQFLSEFTPEAKHL